MIYITLQYDHQVVRLSGINNNLQTESESALFVPWLSTELLTKNVY